jgi:hypothetical protein
VGAVFAVMTADGAVGQLEGGHQEPPSTSKFSQNGRFSTFVESGPLAQFDGAHLAGRAVAQDDEVAGEGEAVAGDGVGEFDPPVHLPRVSGCFLRLRVTRS